jgi:hypothetical protein
MFHYISVEAQHGRPVGYDMVLDWLSTEHHLSVLADKLRHVIRRSDAFKTVFRIAIESGRCQVTVKAIQEHFQQLAAEIENMPATFVFNADESGFQEFVNAREVQI